jgi:hypothetical protein
MNSVQVEHNKNRKTFPVACLLYTRGQWGVNFEELFGSLPGFGNVINFASFQSTWFWGIPFLTPTAVRLFVLGSGQYVKSDNLEKRIYHGV